MTKGVCAVVRIVDELRQKIFNQSSGFLDKLANTWYDTNAWFLAYSGKENLEHIFLNILTEEIHKSLADCRIFTSVSLKGISELPYETKVDKVLGMRREDIREKVCWPTYRDVNCRFLKRCFDGVYPSGTEIDALITRGRDFCFLEFEKERQGMCDNFMKMYRLQQLLSRPFESLFVTRLTTTRQPEGPTTFESFNTYVDNVKTILDTLLRHWSILEIVNLKGSERSRHFHWRS